MRSKINNITARPVLLVVAVFAIMSVTGGAAVADKLLTGKNVKNSSLTGLDVKNSSLSGVDVKNGTIGTADLSTAALAATKGPKGDKGDKGDQGETGSFAPVGILTTTSANSTASTTFIDVPGMATTYTSPTGTTKLLLEYTAECSVIHATSRRFTSVRILVDGVEASPASSINFAFCTTDDDPTTDRWVGAAMQRVISVSPGTHDIRVQFAVSGTGATGRLDDDMLSIIAG